MKSLESANRLVFQVNFNKKDIYFICIYYVSLFVCLFSIYCLCMCMPIIVAYIFVKINSLILIQSFSKGAIILCRTRIGREQKKSNKKHGRIT